MMAAINTRNHDLWARNGNLNPGECASECARRHTRVVLLLLLRQPENQAIGLDTCPWMGFCPALPCLSQRTKAWEETRETLLFISDKVLFYFGYAAFEKPAVAFRC